NRSHHLVALISDDIEMAIDDDLRRVDAGSIHRLGIGFLAIGVGFRGQRVLPAQHVPVGDRQRECDDVLAFSEFRDNAVSRGTIAAALAGEELDDNRTRTLQLSSCRWERGGGSSKNEY